MKIINRDKINFILGDCIEFMKTKPDNYYDLAIVDPPYGIGMGNIENHNASVKRKLTKYKKKAWDSNIPTKEYWDELFRISKNQIVFGGNYFTEHLPISKSWVFWDKLQPFDFTNYQGELVYLSNGTGIRKCVISIASGSNRVSNGSKSSAKYIRIHPTQKPVKLYRWFLVNYAEKGMKILDTHGGSHSNAIACDMEGFNLDIIEIDTDYYLSGLNAFDEYKRQLKLF